MWYCGITTSIGLKALRWRWEASHLNCDETISRGFIKFQNLVSLNCDLLHSFVKKANLTSNQNSAPCFLPKMRSSRAWSGLGFGSSSNQGTRCWTRTETELKMPSAAELSYPHTRGLQGEEASASASVYWHSEFHLSKRMLNVARQH